VILEFPSGQSCYVCGHQLGHTSGCNSWGGGTTGRIEIEIPFNAPPDVDRILLLMDATLAVVFRMETTYDLRQVTVQGDAFSRAIREGGEVTYRGGCDRRNIGGD